MINIRARAPRRGFPLANADSARVIRALSIAGTLPAGSASAAHAFIDQAQREGWWSKLIAFYGFMGGTPAAHGINWVDPDLYEISNDEWSTGATHDHGGVKFDGLTGFGNTGVTPTALGLTGGLGVCLLESASALTHCHIGVESGIDRYWMAGWDFFARTIAFYGGPAIYAQSELGALPTPVGCWYVQRSAPEDLSLYGHGRSRGSQNLTVTPGLLSLEIYLGARNTNGAAELLSSGRYGAAWLSDGTLTPGEIESMTYAIQRMQLRIGRVVTLQDGIWSPEVHPLAVREEGTQDRILIGSIGSDQHLTVASYNKTTGELTKTDLGEAPQTTDTNAPALLPGADPAVDPLTVFWSGDGTDTTALQWRRSTLPESIAAFTSVAEIPVAEGTAFVQAHRIGPRIVVLARRGPSVADGPRPWIVAVSEDNGENWVTRDLLVPDGITSSTEHLRVLSRLSVQGRVLHLAIEDDAIEGTNQDLILLSADLQDGGVFQPASGERVGHLYQDGGDVSPFEAGFPIVFADPGEKTRLYDVSRDGRMVAYASYTGTGDGRYVVAVLDACGVIRKQVLGLTGAPLESPAGSAYAFGGIRFGEQPGVVYLAREASGTYRVERWETHDEGASWNSELLSLSDATTKRFRPVPVVHGGAGEPLLWCEGTYLKSAKEDFDEPEQYWDTTLRLRLG